MSNSMWKTSKRNCGFTLCELITVIAIMSIIASTGTISLLRFKQKHQATGLANLIKSDLNRAKILAARYKSSVVLQIHGSFYELFVDNGAGEATADDWLRQAQEPGIARRDIVPTVSLESNFPGNHLRLRPLGRIRPGTFTIRSRSGEQFKVVVNAVGRIRLEDAG